MPIRLRDLVAQVSPDTERMVGAVRTRFNQGVRQLLRQETGLRLAMPSTAGEEGAESSSVRISIVPGVPHELEEMVFDDDRWLAILLSPWREILIDLHTAASEVKSRLLPELLRSQVQSRRFGEAGMQLAVVEKLAMTLLQDSAKFDLVREIHAIRDDILGRYCFEINLWDEERPNARIELYWGVIGLVAKALGVSVEGLTAMVLAHELAHAYTHLGMDIDGRRWNSESFAKSDLDLKEGLAQYYAFRVVDRLATKCPDARQAFEALLPRQPEPYRTHEKWLELEHSPEEIRFAMLGVRRRGENTLDAFEAGLAEARERLTDKH